LGSVQAGAWEDAADTRFVALLEAGAPPHELRTAFVHG
jgi:hypothetical protein